MLIDFKTIKDYTLHGVDGEVGSIKEFFFDDKYWTLRYLIANTGSWLSRRRVLISPYFLNNIDHQAETIQVNLTKSEIENSPELGTDKPVSRQFEEDYYKYYGAPVYWGGPYSWGPLQNVTHDREKWRTVTTNEDRWDPNLRSSDEVSGYDIHASNDEIGHIDDFILDDESWVVRYLIVDTRTFLPGKKVLISPQWVERFSWEEGKVYVNLSSEAIKNAPEYDDDVLLTREFETQLHQYYNRQGYWTDENMQGDFSRSSRSRVR